MKPTLISARRSLHCFTLCGFLLGGVSPTTAATLTVTNLNDGGPGTLRQVILNASSGDTIGFAVSGTVTLTNGQMVIAKDLTIQGPGATNLTLDAQFNNRIFEVQTGTVSMAGLRLINGFATNIGGAVFNNGKLSVTQCGFSNNFSIEHGGAVFSGVDLTVSQCLFTDDFTLGVGHGGAIYSAGKLAVLDCTIQHCIAVSGGGLAIFSDTNTTAEVRGTTFTDNSAHAGGDGGAINNRGNATAIGCRFERNIAPHGYGNAINDGGTMVISNCVVANNGNYLNPTSPGGEGGGVSCEGTTLIVDSQLLNNSAVAAGGILVDGNAIIRRCTIANNYSPLGGHGVVVFGQRAISDSTISGNNGYLFNSTLGGIWVFAGQLWMTNCTLFENAGTAGAIYNSQGQVILDSCTVTTNIAVTAGGGIFNSAGTITMRNCIVAGNTTLGNTNAYFDLAGDFISGGHNLIGKSDGSTGFTNGAVHDLVGTIASSIDAKLGPLQDHGGPTWTHALLSNSPAIDAGHSGGLLTDQRGGVRSYVKPGNTNVLAGDGSDIGAFESGGYLRLTSVNKTNNDIRVQFTTDLGHDYRVERRAALDTNAWTALPGLVPGTGGIVPFVETNAALLPKGFYRVRAD